MSIAVCQPCVQALAAAALMAEDDHPAQPRSMTLMAGPIDTRVNPTKVNELATGKPIEWFERNLISRVPLRYPGAMRRVYPGFLQLTAFMSMNAERHIKAQVDLYKAMANGEHEQANTIKAFYDEYFAVLDMTAEFYLETVQWVFQDHLLARGELDWHGRRVNPKAIRRTALFTIEGERDDICAIGQTVAAHDLCTSLQALPQEALHAGRRRPLRRVQRPAVGQPDLSLGAKHDPGQRVASTSENALSVIARGVTPALERSEGSHGVATGDEVLRLRSGRQIWYWFAPWLTFRRRPWPTGKRLAAKELRDKPVSSLDWMTPEGIAVKPLYTAADLEEPRDPRRAAGLRAVHARAQGHDVRRPALDDPPVRRLLHRRGDERVLPRQPRGRPDGPVGGVRPRHPPRLRLRPPARRRRRRQGGRGHRLGRGHEDPVRRHPARQDVACR